MATKNQSAHALATYFNKGFLKKTGREYKGNIFRDKWGYQAMLEDLGEKRSKEVIDWYFQTARDEFSPLDLHKNYDKLSETLYDYEEEKARRLEALERTKAAVERFKQRGKSGLD